MELEVLETKDLESRWLILKFNPQDLFLSHLLIDSLIPKILLARPLKNSLQLMDLISEILILDIKHLQTLSQEFQV
jgi:hypothetical protein